MFYWGIFHIFFFFILFAFEKRYKTAWISILVFFIFGFHKIIDSYDSVRTINKFIKSKGIDQFLSEYILKDDYFYGLCVGVMVLLSLGTISVITMLVLGLFGVIDLNEYFNSTENK